MNKRIGELADEAGFYFYDMHNDSARKAGYFNPEYDWDDEDGYSFCAREFS